MLNLSFVRTHLSITNFPPTSLPDFTIITGPNGAGKSHLLQAIHGAVATDASPSQGPHNQNQVRLFDWSTMVPQDTGYFASENIRQERQSLYQNYTNLRDNQGWLEPVRSIVRSAGLPQEFLSEPGRLLRLNSDELKEIFIDGEENVALKQVRSAFGDLERQILQHMDPNMQAQILGVASFLKRPMVSLTERDILSPAIPTWGQIDLFQQSFARLFVAYRDILLANTLAEFRASKGQDVQYYTEEEFTVAHGPAPWDFVNSSLESAGLDFFINHPNLDDYTQFQPMLTKRSTGINVPFSALSSGEKVLMSFAFCVYYSNDRRQISVQPKVLLLDEIDAPLHPSMSRNVIDTILRTLVGQFGIKVIATTHSPSTIALSPDESIYTMQPGTPGLTRRDKASALNILTVGVPTISISFDGRRQVFVESPRDAKVYDGVYKLLKPKIVSERSLEFVATGTRNAQKQEQNTGCDVVKRLVSDLTRAGNISVFGLLDWDGEHNPDERIAVLAHGVRNGLENVFLDPLPLGIGICRSIPSLKTEIGLNAETTYLQLVSASAETLQSMVLAITTKVFGSPPDNTLVSTYAGGLSLEIDSRYFSMDDHKLEALIAVAFPQLSAVSKKQDGKLIEHIIENVFTDCPQFIPNDLKLVSEDLLG
uniref:AAA family ATPase n=1 Tax=Rhizobium sp. TaxID=391 RepID=UPI0028AE5752